jgi:lipoprotein-anchoring transpeptidase ErfK/SrfK
MADYTQFLARAVALLDPNTPEQRQALYDRARRALVDRLRGNDPTLRNTDLAAEGAALEASIRRVEAAAARRAAPRPANPPVQGYDARPEPYQDRPPLKDGPRPLRIAALAFGVLVVLLAGFAAYSLWPRGGTLAPRMASETAEQPAANVPYIYLRQPVYYRTTYPVGTIIVDKVQNFLYVVRPNTSALRYGIGTGSECVSLAGFFKILRKEEWPGWKPPPQQSAGAADDRMKNPLGARALYLDTDNRIHGTNASFTIGQRTRDGCIRLVNDDVIYFYDRTPLESRVVVLN